MSIRFPAGLGRLGLGVGLDLPWGRPAGFVYAPARGDGVAESVPRFLQRHAQDFRYLFVSWQPRNRNRLHADDYVDVWDALFAALPEYPIRALHHTALNLGAADSYDRLRLFEVTN